MAFEPLLRLFVAWPEDKDLIPHPEEITSPGAPLEIKDIVERQIGDDYTFSKRFYDRNTIEEASSRPFEDREANWEGIEDIANAVEELITGGEVDVSQRNQVLGVQNSDVVIRVVNSHANAPTQRWRTDQPVTYTFPVVDHGNVYGLKDDIIAFDGESGDINWRYSSDNRMFKVPTTIEDFVLVQDGSEVVCLSPGDGSVRWRLECGLPLGIASRFERINDFIYFGTTEGEFYRFSLDGTELELIFDAYENVYLDTFAHSHGLFFANGTARSLDDGSLSWKFPTSEGRGPRILGSSENHIYLSCDGVLYATDPDSGNPDWRKQFDATRISTLKVSKHGQTYILANNSLIALTDDTGSEEWRVELDRLVDTQPANELARRRELPSDINVQGLSQMDNQLFVLSNEEIAAIEQNGDILWRHVFAQESANPNGICHYDGNLWIPTEVGDLYGVSVTDGRETGRYESASPMSSPTLLDGDLIMILKTYEHSHFDGHKQRIENEGEFTRLEI